MISLLFILVLSLVGMVGGIGFLILNAIRLIGMIISRAALLGIFIYVALILIDVAIAFAAYLAFMTWAYPIMLL